MADDEEEEFVFGGSQRQRQQQQIHDDTGGDAGETTTATGASTTANATSSAGDDDLDALKAIDSDDDDHEGNTKTFTRTKDPTAGVTGTGENGAASNGEKKKKKKKRDRDGNVIKKKKSKKQNKGEGDEFGGDGDDEDDDDIDEEDDDIDDDDMDVINGSGLLEGEAGESSKKSKKAGQENDEDFIAEEDDLIDVRKEYDQEVQDFLSEDESDDDRPRKNLSHSSSRKSQSSNARSSSIATDPNAKRSKKGDLTEEEKKEKIKEVCQLMESSVKEDRRLLKNSQPAVTKLNNLNRVMDVLNKKDLWEPLFDAGGMRYIMMWLAPPQKNIMPNMEVRTRLIELLSRMQLDMELLEQESFDGLPNLIAFLAENKDETPENKDLLQKMLNKWKTEFLRKDDSRSARAQHASAEETPTKLASTKKKHKKPEYISSEKGKSTALHSNRLSGSNANRESSKVRAAIPQNMVFDVRINPEDVVESSSLRRGGLPAKKSEADEQLEKRLANMGNSNKKKGASVNLSIGGS